jgi:hypothetical protein
MPSLSRRVTIYAGVGALCLIILALLVFQKEIKAQYHFLHLCNKPRYLAYILHEPEGSPQRAAVRKYLRSREGKTALFEHVLWIVGQTIDKFVEAKRPYIVLSVDVEQGRLEIMDEWRISAESEEAKSVVFRNDPPKVQDSPVKAGSFKTKRDSQRVTWNWIQLISEYLDDGEQVTVDRYPGIVVEFRRKLPR